MQPMYYIGLDVHKQKISYCVKDVGGKISAEGWIPATRCDLDRWMKTLPEPWSAALEAHAAKGCPRVSSQLIGNAQMRCALPDAAKAYGFADLADQVFLQFSVTQNLV